MDVTTEQYPVVHISGAIPTGLAVRPAVPWSGEATLWLATRGIATNRDLLPCEVTAITPASQALFDQHVFEQMCTEIKNKELLDLVKRLGPSSIPLFASFLINARWHGEVCVRSHLPPKWQ
jgi:hypothetical protein